MDSILQGLLCPFCGGSLACEFKDGYGTLTCSCYHYPILDGIPILKQDFISDHLLELVEKGCFKEALAYSLQPPFEVRALEKWARRVGRFFPPLDFSDHWPRKRLQRVMHFLARNPFPTFEEFLRFIFLESEVPFPLGYDYFYFRPTSPTFLTNLALLKFQDFRSGPVLDLCCGCGHLSRHLTEVAEGPVVGLDERFIWVWLAKRFLAPGAHFICTDVNFPLPFSTNRFKTVLCSDALFDVRNMQGIARETLRVVSPEGKVFVTRLLNRSKEHVYRGHNPLNPEEYERLFQGFCVKLYSEQMVLKDYLNSKSLNNLQFQPAEALADETTVGLIASRKEILLETCDREVERIPGRWAINPQYMFDPSSRKLTRSLPSAEYKREYVLESLYLPESFQLDSSTAFETLVEKRLVIPLPENYSRLTPELTHAFPQIRPELGS